MDHPCYPCQKLSNMSECGGCILKEYFTTDAEIDNLKVLCKYFQKETVKDIVRDIKNDGGSVNAFIKFGLSLVPHLTQFTETTTVLKRELDDLNDQFINLSNAFNELKSNHSSPSVAMRLDHPPVVGSPIVGSRSPDGGDDDIATTIVPNSLDGGN